MSRKSAVSYGEVENGNKDMWNAVRMISQTVDRDRDEMRGLTHDVATLRGRQGGGVPLVKSECSDMQSSCLECTSMPTCVWCKATHRFPAVVISSVDLCLCC